MDLTAASTPLTLNNPQTYIQLQAGIPEGCTAKASVSGTDTALTGGWDSVNIPYGTVTVNVVVSDGNDSTIYVIEVTNPTPELGKDDSLYSYKSIIVKNPSNYDEYTVYQADESGTKTESTEISNNHKNYYCELPADVTQFWFAANPTQATAKIRYSINGGEWQSWANSSSPVIPAPAKITFQIISEENYVNSDNSFGEDPSKWNEFNVWIEKAAIAGPKLESFALMSSNTSSATSVADITVNNNDTTYDVTLNSYNTSYAYINATFAEGVTATYTVDAKYGNLTSGGQNEWFNFGDEGTTTTLTVTLTSGEQSTTYTFNITRPTRPLEADNTLYADGLVVKYEDGVNQWGSANYTSVTIYQADSTGTATESTTQSNDHKYYAAVLPEGVYSFVTAASLNGAYAQVRYRVNDGEWETWGYWSAPSKDSPARVEIQIISEAEYKRDPEGWGTAESPKTTNNFTLWVTTERDNFTADTADVYVTIANGALELIQKSVHVTDTDRDGVLTIHDALTATHEANKPGGYETAESEWGLVITKLWEISNGGSYGYYLNGEYQTGLKGTPLHSGDHLDAYIYTDLTYWSDTYCYFNKRTASGDQGDTLELTLTSNNYGTKAPVSGATITFNGHKTHYKTDADGKVTVTLDTPGHCIISAVSDSQLLVPPACVAEVEPTPVNGPKLFGFVFSESLESYTFDPDITEYEVTLTSSSANYSYLTATFNEGLTVTYTHNKGADSGELTSGNRVKWINFNNYGTTVLEVTVSDGQLSTVYTFKITRPEPPRNDDNTLTNTGITVEYGSSYPYTEATVYQASDRGVADTTKAEFSNDHKYYAAVLPEGVTTFMPYAYINDSGAKGRYRVNEGEWRDFYAFSPDVQTPAKVDIQIISDKEYFSGVEGWTSKEVNSFTLWVKTEGAAEPPRLTSVDIRSMESWEFNPEIFTYDLVATQGYTMGGSAAAPEGFDVVISPSLSFLSLYDGTVTPVTITVTDGFQSTVYTFNITKYENRETALGDLQVTGIHVVHATAEGLPKETSGILENQLYYEATIPDNKDSFTFTAKSAADTSYLRYSTDGGTTWSDAHQGTLSGTEEVEMDSQLPIQIQISSSSAFSGAKTYTLFATRGLPDSSVDWEGSGTSEAPYLLETPEDMELLRTLVNTGNAFEYVHFRMENDITLPDGWTVIGSHSDTPFAGTLDGNGKLLTVPDYCQPLLGHVQDATITDLNIYGTHIAGNGLINNYEGPGKTGTVTITGVTLKSGSSTLRSGLIGGEITSNSYAVSSTVFTVNISNCTVESGVTVGYDGNQSCIGGIAGRVNGTISGCVCNATVQGVNYVGGILGTKDNAMGNTSVSSCTFGGTVKGNTNVGGIVGGGYNGVSGNAIRVSVNGCQVTENARISGSANVGGILGGDTAVLQAWDAYTFKNNSVYGSVSGNSHVGAIIGHYESLNKFDDIQLNQYAGDLKGIGFVRYVDTSCATHETTSGASYLNTAGTFDKICNSENQGITKADHNRTDDPLGADAHKLAKPFDVEVAPYITGLEISGDYKWEYEVGEELDLTGIVIKAVWNTGEKEVVKIGFSEDNVKVTGYDKDKLGTQKLTLTYRSVSAQIEVVVKAKGKITVYFTLLGDSHHGETDDPHTLIGGGLQTWIGTTAYTVDANSTVFDVFKQALSEKGYSYVGSGTYVSAVGGLAALDNGPLSGWMYTVNGGHPDVGMAQQHLHDGDSIVFHYTDDYNKESGKDSDDDKTAKEVIEKINAIGTVTFTPECKQRIDEARAAYNALSYAEKKKVTNLSTLEAAEKKYEELKKADDLEKAEAVDALIAKIGTPITEKSESAILAARAAYDALTPEQKALVKKLKVLTDAEADFALLTATEEDKAKAKAVSELIDALGEITLESEEKIKEAREAYDKLTDLQKKLVRNYDVLEAAEKELERLKELDKHEDAYLTTGNTLEKVKPVAGNEWIVLGLIRSGKEVDESYLDSVRAYIRENVDENNRLHRSKSTENARMILALTAMGVDATNVDGIDLVAGLNDMEYLQKQGLNGPIWALIALDCGNYPDPEDGDATRENIIKLLLDAQCEDGGWTLAGELADPDLTGMALQALAPYYEANEDVRLAVDTALEVLSQMQNEDGSFSTGGTATSESVSQVIVALTALGINPDTDERFIKNGVSALDALLSFYVEGGGFKHLLSGKVNDIATEQAYYALTAYDRFLKDETRLYDMTDVFDKTTAQPAPVAPEPKEEESVVIETQEPVKAPAPAPAEAEEDTLGDHIAMWFFSGLERVLSWFL